MLYVNLYKYTNWILENTVIIITEKSSLIFSPTCRAISIQPKILKFWSKI